VRPKYFVSVANGANTVDPGSWRQGSSL
jgi:hypothetical protein